MDLIHTESKRNTHVYIYIYERAKDQQHMTRTSFVPLIRLLILLRFLMLKNIENKSEHMNICTFIGICI